MIQPEILEDTRIIYFQERYAEICYFEDKDLLEVTWFEAPINFKEFQLTLSKAFVVLKQFGISNWINNISDKKEIGNEELQWIKQFILPNLLDIGIKKVAFIAKKGALNRSQIIGLRKIVKDRDIAVSFFETEELAYKWIGVVI